IYSQMMSGSGSLSGGTSSMTLLCGLSADEFDNLLSSTDMNSFYTNTLTSTNSILMSSFWKDFYQYIYNANAALEGLSHSTKVTPSLKAQLQGEALFIRALCNFYLTNLFGDIPV